MTNSMELLLNHIIKLASEILKHKFKILPIFYPNLNELLKESRYIISTYEKTIQETSTLNEEAKSIVSQLSKIHANPKPSMSMAF